LANIASLLKEEIIRLARKELRAETEGLKKASSQYRSDIAALKRRAAALEKQLANIEKSIARTTEIEIKPEAASKSRFTANGFKTLRQRLGLTAQIAGDLLGVSAQTIYSWEAGNTSPREQQMERIVMLRSMGKREVDSIVQQLAK
jgi:DNA-binding transcriptional regulator YiaG